MQEWQTSERVSFYLSHVGSLPHRIEGETTLLDLIPTSVQRVLDLGTGDGRLLGLVKAAHPQIVGIALDFSPPMLERARKRFAEDPTVTVIEHNMEHPLPALEAVDVVISSFAIHHLEHPRKKALYAEIFEHLTPGGVFCNLEHVASPSERMHESFYEHLGRPLETEDRSNKLLDVETQLGWLREIGFKDVDCYWKWLEFALIGGVK